MAKRKVVIMGAAGRDFHNFNCLFRDNPEFEVVAFTATQIPDIEGRMYPPSLAGKLYPKGIPIFAEAELEKLVKEQRDRRRVVLLLRCAAPVRHGHGEPRHRLGRELRRLLGADAP